MRKALRMPDPEGVIPYNGPIPHRGYEFGLERDQTYAESKKLLEGIAK